MDRYTVICHRCGKPTVVDLSRTVSDQRCRACRGFLRGVSVNTESEHRATGHRRLVEKGFRGGGKEPEWDDQDAAVIPLHKEWPGFFRLAVWGGLAFFLAAMAWVAHFKYQQSIGGSREALVQEDPPPVDVRVTPLWRDKATAFARRVLAAKDANELLPLLYHPEVSEDVIRRYYQSTEKLPLGSDLQEEYIIPPGYYREQVVAFHFNDAVGRLRAFVVVEKPDGFKVDWPSLVGYGEMSVLDFIQTVPKGVVVLRARARLGEYHNDYFNDTKRWLSIRLSDVTDENVMHGYFDLEQPGMDKVGKSFPGPKSSDLSPEVPVIVVLKHPAGNRRSDQAVIVSLLSANNWYLEEGLRPHIEQARKLDAFREATAGNNDAQAPPAAGPKGTPGTRAEETRRPAPVAPPP